MIRKWIEQNGWYGDSTLEGDYVSLHRDSHISVNSRKIELPVGIWGKENVLQLVCLRWQGQILIAGQGQIGDKGSGNWLYKNGEWKVVSQSFATFSCAFSSSYLYLVVGPNLYCLYDIVTDKLSEPIARVIGVNGIRYIDFSQSPDGIVTGDSTYGPDQFNLSQYTRRDEIVIGQSYNGGAIALYDDKRYKLENGDTQFIRFKRSGSNICVTIVKMLETSTVFYWMDVSDIKLFPIEGTNSNSPPANKEPGPINNEPSDGENMSQAPNKLETVKRMMRLHPEIDCMDEDERGIILDYVCKAENKPGMNKPWGRKARNKDGSNKNTDGLTFLRSDDKFEIIDAISGINGSATWDHAGIFAQGENGWWAEGEPVNGSSPIPEPKPKPEELKPIMNKDEIRDGANQIINFYTSEDGLQRSKPPIDVNDQAAWDWVSVFLQLVLSGKTKSEAVEEVKRQIKLFPEWKDKHQ